MTNILFSYVIQGLCIGIGTTIGVFIANKSFVNRMETILKALKKELEPILFVKQVSQPSQIEQAQQIPEGSISKPIQLPQETIGTSEIGNAYEFSSKVVKHSYTYYALLPKELIAKFPQYLGVRRDIKLRLVIK